MALLALRVRAAAALPVIVVNPETLATKVRPVPLALPARLALREQPVILAPTVLLLVPRAKQVRLVLLVQLALPVIQVRPERLVRPGARVRLARQVSLVRLARLVPLVRFATIRSSLL